MPTVPKIRKKFRVRGIYIACLITGLSFKGRANEIEIIGWPNNDIFETYSPLWLGQEPVIGRMICPTLTRYNLEKSRSQGLVLKKIESFHENNKWIWRVTPRSGIFWWSGAPVTVDDIAQYIEENLEEIVRQKGGGLWQLPKYQIKNIKNHLDIIWTTRPLFGPYVFNGASLLRSSSHSLIKFECAGLYYPTLISDEKMELSPNSGYKFSRRALFFRKSPSTIKSRDRINFALAKGRPKNAGCQKRIGLPLVTTIVWNQTSSTINNAKFRRLLVDLIPKKALAKQGTGSLGRVPGFLSLWGVRTKNLPASDTVMKSLETLGYKRPFPYGPLQNKHGHEVSLTFTVEKESSRVIEKVLFDTFSAAGIRLLFVPAETRPQNFDGSIVGMRMPWPEMNLLTLFHSGFSDHFPSWGIRVPELDKILEAHSLDLSMGGPNKKRILRIESQLQLHQPHTPLISHQACLTVSDKLQKNLHNLKISDPDWFRKLLI